MKIDLIHGDCLEEMKKIPDGGIDLVLTDPPYGTTACKWDTVIPLEPMWEQLKRVTKKNGAIVLFGSQPFTSALVMSNPKMFKYEWVWEKSHAANFMSAKRRPLTKHENVLVFSLGKENYYPNMVKGKQKMNRSGEVLYERKKESIYGSMPKVLANVRNDTYYPISVQKFSSGAMRERIHPTQKPVALMEYLIKTYTNEGETVLDFTMGSGTTGVACKNLNRDFIGIELDETYFEIATKRINSTPNT